MSVTMQVGLTYRVRVSEAKKNNLFYVEKQVEYFATLEEAEAAFKLTSWEFPMNKKYWVALDKVKAWTRVIDQESEIKD